MATELTTFEASTSEPVSPSAPQNGEADAALIPENLPPMDRGRGAWMFCISACVLELLIWGFGFSFGVFQSWYTSNPPFFTQSPVAVTAVGASALGVQYFEGLVLMALLQMRPEWMRTIMWGCLLGCSLCFLISSFTTQVWQLILVQGVLFGMFAGILYFPLLFWLYDWFNEKRSLAGGILWAGSGIGGIIFPPLASALLDNLGYQWTLRIFCVMYLAIGALALLGAKPRIPVNIIRRQGRTYNLKAYFRQFKFVTRPLFIANSAIILLQGLGYFPVALYIPTYTASLGYSALTGSLVLATFNFVCFIAQIILGWLCSKIPYLQVMFYSSLFSSIAAFTLLGFAGSLSLVFVFVVIYGSLAGGFTAVWTEAAVDTSAGDPTLRGPVLLAFSWARGTASIGGPIIAGLLYERSRDKETQLYGSMMLATSVVAAGTAWWKNHKR